MTSSLNSWGNCKRSWSSGISMEGKVLQVNVDKTKVLISGLGIDMLQKSGKDPSAVCLSGAGTHSNFCGGFSIWVHKTCNGISGTLKHPTFRGERWVSRPIPKQKSLPPFVFLVAIRHIRHILIDKVFLRKHFISLSNHTNGTHKCAGFWW